MDESIFIKNTLAKNVQHVTEMCNTRRFHFFSVRFFYSKKNFWWKKCLFLFIGRRFLNQKAQFFNKISCYNPTICPVQTVLKNSSSGRRQCQTKFYVRVSAGEKKKVVVFFCQSLLKKISLYTPPKYTKKLRGTRASNNKNIPWNPNSSNQKLITLQPSKKKHPNTAFPRLFRWRDREHSASETRKNMCRFADFGEAITLPKQCLFSQINPWAPVTDTYRSLGVFFRSKSVQKQWKFTHKSRCFADFVAKNWKIWSHKSLSQTLKSLQSLPQSLRAIIPWSPVHF